MYDNNKDEKLFIVCIGESLVKFESKFESNIESMKLYMGGGRGTFEI